MEVEVGTDDSALACNHELNVSLGDGCKSVLEPEDILTSEITGNVAYQLILTDTYGNTIQGNQISDEHLWTTITAKVMNPCSGNSCWANINVEDKLAPRIQCDDIEVPCHLVHNYVPLVTDNCSTAEFRLTFESTTPLPCGSPYIQQVFRTYELRMGSETCQLHVHNKSMCYLLIWMR